MLPLKSNYQKKKFEAIINYFQCPSFSMKITITQKMYIFLWITHCLFWGMSMSKITMDAYLAVTHSQSNLAFSQMSPIMQIKL